MQIRDRIVELRRVRAADLRPHPKNWRTHSETQKNALQGLLAEVGYAGALLARQLVDGSLQLIDGHLRAETTPESLVPVLVLDVDEAEASKILATHDPLAAMAGVDGAALAELLSDVETENAAVQELLDGLTAPAEVPTDAPLPDVTVPKLFQVVVECADEAEQQAVYERLTAEGLKCRLLML